MGDYWYLYVLPIIGGIIWWLLSSALVRMSGNLLQNNFAKLTEDTNGVLAGKTLDEVKAACGDPSAVSSIGNGQMLYQWQATGYHIALVFDENDVCVGIRSEIAV